MHNEGNRLEWVRQGAVSPPKPSSRIRRIAAAITAGVMIAVVAPGSPVTAGNDGARADSEIDVSELELKPRAHVWRSTTGDGLNGTTIGPDGLIYVASVGGSEITVHHPWSGRIIDRIGAERGVNGPDDVFVTDDGTIYWTDLLGGNVGMLKPDGTFTTQQVGPGVNPITISDDGRLFVGRIFLGDGLYELDPDLVDPPREILPGPLSINAFDFGPDGLLYAPSLFTGQIVRIDVDAANPVPEVVADGLVGPAAAKFNSKGELFAADLASGQIVSVDIDTGATEVVAQVDGTIDNFAFDARDRLVLIAGADGQIIRVNRDGSLRPLMKPGFTAPGGVAVTDDGTLWVADFFAMRGFTNIRLEPSINFYDRFLPPGIGFGGANTVSADGNNVITTFGFGNAVQVLTPDGDALVDIRTLNIPANAIRHGSAIVAAQLGAGNVVNAETGEVVAEGFAYPLGLASDGDTLYVSDYILGTISAVAADGTVTEVVSGLAGPEGLAMDRGVLYVVEEQADRVSAVDVATGETAVVIEGLALGDLGPIGSAPNGGFNGIAIDERGNVFVVADDSNTVERFRIVRGRPR